jgi:hypothetical protein
MSSVESTTVLPGVHYMYRPLYTESLLGMDLEDGTLFVKPIIVLSDMRPNAYDQPLDVYFAT